MEAGVAHIRCKPRNGCRIAWLGVHPGTSSHCTKVHCNYEPQQHQKTAALCYFAFKVKLFKAFCFVPLPKKRGCWCDSGGTENPRTTHGRTTGEPRRIRLVITPVVFTVFFFWGVFLWCFGSVLILSGVYFLLSSLLFLEVNFFVLLCLV